MTTDTNSFTLKCANISVIELISGSEAVKQLQRIDDFIANLSTFDLQARLNSALPTLDDYLESIKQHVLAWNEESSRSIAACISFINTTCADRLSLLFFPPRLLVILTDGKDESNAAYCRNENVIVVPQSMVSSALMRNIFIHELFHIWSKWHTNTRTRDALYASIGYHRIPTEKRLALPANLSALKITNPDAPLVMQYYINLRQRKETAEKVYKCTPILHAAQPFDPNFSSNFFEYLVATTLILDDNTYEPLASSECLPYDAASNFYEQIGNNTNYIIHPEEILAENFVLWMTGASDPAQLKTPAIVDRMDDVISSAARSV